MASETNTTNDRIALFLIFSLAAAALITAIFVFGYGAELNSVVHIAGLGGLSAGCIASLFGMVFERKAPGVPPVAVERALPQRDFASSRPAPPRSNASRQSAPEPVQSKSAPRETRGGLKVSPDRRDHVLSFSSEMERAGS